MVVGEEQERLIKHGSCVVMEDGITGANGESRCRAYNQDGCFIAILHFDPEKKQWQPEKVFA